MILIVCLRVLKVYDIQTGQKTLTLNDPALANNYKRNCATFSPTDDLVLNDGVLWDVRASRAIHKFDKFNMNISGVFHPNGLEVIINTEIVSSDAARGRLFCPFLSFTAKNIVKMKWVIKKRFWAQLMTCECKGAVQC